MIDNVKVGIHNYLPATNKTKKQSNASALENISCKKRHNPYNKYRLVNKGK